MDYYTIPNNASALDGHGYDYLEQAEILKNTVSEISSNLINCQKSHPEFISSHTGMSLSDLLDEYNYVGDVEIPYLFSEILGGKLTQNREVLLKKYQERYNTYIMEGDVDTEKVAAVLEVIQSYGNKNKDGSLYYQKGARTGTEDDAGGFVLSEVYEYDTKVDRTTVYDTLDPEPQVQQRHRRCLLPVYHRRVPGCSRLHGRFQREQGLLPAVCGAGDRRPAEPAELPV